MTDPQPVPAAVNALNECDATLDKLVALCCDPGRSPSMAALAETVADARVGLGSFTGEPEAADAVLEQLEDAGSQVGRLQVGCCAPARLPLYNRLLEGLTLAQLAVNDAVGRGH